MRRRATSTASDVRCCFSWCRSNSFFFYPRKSKINTVFLNNVRQKTSIAIVILVFCFTDTLESRLYVFSHQGHIEHKALSQYYHNLHHLWGRKCVSTWVLQGDCLRLLKVEIQVMNSYGVGMRETKSSCHTSLCSQLKLKGRWVMLQIPLKKNMVRTCSIVGWGSQGSSSSWTRSCICSAWKFAMGLQFQREN